MLEYKNDYSSAEDGCPLSYGKECDPTYVIEWIDDNFIIVPKDWVPWCSQSDFCGSGGTGCDICPWNLVKREAKCQM
jgi:hypothetical protein